MKILLPLLALLAFLPVSALAENPKMPELGVRNVTPDEAEKLLKDKPKTIILDVRTPEEFAQGHIAGARNINFLGDDFAEQIKTLPTDQPVLLHCASGARSQQALPRLLNGNFTDLYHLSGGFGAWKKAGKAVQQ